MKVRKWIVASLAVVALLVGSILVYADLPGGGWWTAQQIQAVGGDDTTVTFMAYGQSSGETDCGSVILDQGEAFVYLPTNAWGITPNCGSLPEGFRGSAVVSANNAIVAVVEETNQHASPLGMAGGTADASYRGTSGSETDTVLRFPAYKSNHSGETSTFYIQNAGSASTRLKATFQECNSATPGCSGTGATYIYEMTTYLAPNRMAVIMPSNATGMKSGQGYFGGVTIESLDGQPLAGVVNEHATTANPARYLKSTRAFVPAEADTKLYAPVIKHTYGSGNELTKWSALQIQNVGGATGNFTVTYKIAASGTPSRVGQQIVDNTTCRNIAVGQTCFVMTLFPVSGSGTAQLQAGEYAAATVVGNVDMVAVVNEETMWNYSVAADKQFATYSCVPDSAKSYEVSVPAYKEEWNGRYMGVTVMNVGDAAATITATVKNVNLATPPADLVAKYSGVGASAAQTFWLLSRNQAQSISGATIVSGNYNDFKSSNNSMSITANQPVAVIVNQENSYLTGPAVKLDAANYEGFPLD